MLKSLKKSVATGSLECKTLPLGGFGNWQGLSGCCWCKMEDACKKASGKKSKVKRYGVLKK